MYTPPDPEWKQRVLASFAKQGMMRTLGVDVGSIEPGEVVLRVGHDDRLTQQQGFVHAGVIGSVLDSASGWAALTLMPSGQEVVTVEYKLNLLRPAVGERFEGRSRVVKPGRTLIVAEGALTSTDDPDRLIATMTATLMAVPDS